MPLPPRVSLKAIHSLLLLIAFGLTPHRASAAADDPDWPCQQRLVPELSAGAYWDGPPLPAGGGWQADDRIARLVAAVTPRTISPEDGAAKIEEFANGLTPAEKPTVLPAAFAGILAETNQQRGAMIERIKELARRQRGVAQQVAKANEQASAIPAEATGDDAKRRTEALERQNFLTRMFDETRHTMRYACDAPAEFDAKLGLYARTLQQHL